MRFLSGNRKPPRRRTAGGRSAEEAMAGVVLPWKRLRPFRAISCAIVNDREQERWLQELGNESAPVPLGQEARRLLDLGIDFSRVAQMLHVGQDELLRAVPRVHARVQLPASAVNNLSPVQRLRLEEW